MSNLVQIIIPGLFRTDFNLFIQEFSELELQGLVLLSYILSLKAQISAFASTTLTTKEIQMLDSQKYLAKIIASNTGIRAFIAKISIQRTIGWEATRLKQLALPLEEIPQPIFPGEPDILRFPQILTHLKNVSIITCQKKH